MTPVVAIPAHAGHGLLNHPACSLPEQTGRQVDSGLRRNDNGVDRRIPARPRPAGRNDERRLKRLIHRGHAAHIPVTTVPGHGIAAQVQEQTRRQFKLGLGPQVKAVA